MYSPFVDVCPILEHFSSSSIYSNQGWGIFCGRHISLLFYMSRGIWFIFHCNLGRLELCLNSIKLFLIISLVLIWKWTLYFASVLFYCRKIEHNWKIICRISIGIKQHEENRCRKIYPVIIVKLLLWQRQIYQQYNTQSFSTQTTNYIVCKIIKS